MRALSPFASCKFDGSGGSLNYFRCQFPVLSCKGFAEAADRRRSIFAESYAGIVPHLASPVSGGTVPHVQKSRGKIPKMAVLMAMEAGLVRQPGFLALCPRPPEI
jgi:hypothetical protein